MNKFNSIEPEALKVTENVSICSLNLQKRQFSRLKLSMFSEKTAREEVQF